MNNQLKNNQRNKNGFVLSTLLKCGLAGLAFYLIITPFLPAVVFSLSPPQTSHIEENLVQIKSLKNTLKYLKQIPKENTLVIPKIGVNGPIWEGKSEKILDKGIWHRPKTSTPNAGGNTVLAAHRFMYTQGPITFYHLDKLTVGDKITVFWNKKQYDYEIVETKEVLPTAIEIENDTKEPILTLFTCTPLFSTERRLVVVAKLIDGDLDKQMVGLERGLKFSGAK